MRLFHASCIALFCMALPSVGMLTVEAQPTPVGCEFPVHDGLESDTLHPKAAWGLDGGFVVVYLSGTAHEFGQRVMVRAFDAFGHYRGPAVPVAEETSTFLRHPEVIRDRNGDFLVVWVRREGQFGVESSSLHGRRLTDQGIPIGNAFEIDAANVFAHSDVHLAAFDGGAWVVWTEAGAMDTNVKGRQVSVDGSVLGPEFQLNSITTGPQVEPAIATTSAGDFLAVWRGRTGSEEGIFGRRFDSTGAPMGADVTIAASVSRDFDDPDVATNDDRFLVVWSEEEAFGDDEVFGRQLDLNGTPVADSVRLQGSSDVDITEPSVGARGTQDFVVVWNEFDYPGFGYIGDARMHVGGRTVSADGVLGSDFAVSSEMDGYTLGGLTFRPDVATAPTGDDFLVVWGDAWIRNSGHPVGSFGQRFDAEGEPSRIDVALRFIESEDPSDGEGLFYSPEIRHQEVCASGNFDLEVQVPQALQDHGFTVLPRQGATCQVTDSIQCSGNLRPGTTNPAVIVAETLPNAADLLEISGSVTVDQTETDLSNNSATETTQVVRCVELTRRFIGKGSQPLVDLDQTPSAPCSLNHFAGGSAVELIAAPAPDGWRIGSWSGTDDDASTSLRNTVTMPPDDHEITVNYVFDQGVHWWTADDELNDLIGNNDLVQVGEGDPFDDGGNQEEAFLLDGDPVLQTGPEGGLGQGNAFSLGFWLRVGASPETERSILDKRQAGAPANRGLYAFLDQGRPALTLGDGNVSQTFTSNRDLRDDTYHLVVYAHQMGRLRIYIDGRLDSTHDTSQVGSFALFAPLTLGTASIGDPRPLHGLLDEIFVTRAALDPERVEHLFLRPRGQWLANGNALDSTAQQLHGTVSEALTYSAGRCGLGFDLTAPGAVVIVPPSTGQRILTNNFAFAAWIRAADAEGLQEIFSMAELSGHRLYLANGLLRYQVGSPGVISGNSLGDLRDGELHFLGISNRDLGGGETEVTLWLDDASFTVVVDRLADAYATGLIFGESIIGPELLDEIMIFDQYLDPAAMQRLRTRSCSQGAFFLDGFESGDVSAWSNAVP